MMHGQENINLRKMHVCKFISYVLSTLITEIKFLYGNVSALFF